MHVMQIYDKLLIFTGWQTRDNHNTTTTKIMGAHVLWVI